MIEIKSKLLPPRGYCAMSLFGIIFIRKECAPVGEVTYNHEAIHTRQQCDTTMFALCCACIACAFAPSIAWFIVAIVLHPALYGCASLYAHIRYRKIVRDAYYRMNAFEREAYANERNATYLNHRVLFNVVRYIACDITGDELSHSN